MPKNEVEPLLQDAEAGGGGGSSADAPSTHKTILGTEVVQDDADWQYCIVFNRVMTESQVQKPMDILQDIFTDRVQENWADSNPTFWEHANGDTIDRSILAKNVWEKVTEILSGASCGFTLGYKPTLDKEKILLLFKCDNEDTTQQLAERMEMKVPLTPEAYTVKGMECPTVEQTFGQWIGWNTKQPPFAPLHMRYDVSTAATFNATTKQRVRKSRETLDRILSGWNPNDGISHGRIRRLMRLEDIRSAVFAMLVEEMEEYELKDPVEFKKRQEIFTAMNVVFEKEKKDRAASMAALSTDAERFQARKRLWSYPEYLRVEQFNDVKLYQDFSQLMILRLIKHRIAYFMDLAALEKHGFIDSVFAVHHKHETEKLSENWGSLRPAAFVQWPGIQMDDDIRDYFGEEVAFFFNWLSYMTRMLVFPALLSIVNSTAAYFLDGKSAEHIEELSAFAICCWVAYLTASYARVCTTNNILWGMTGYNDKGLQRPSYEPLDRGSLKETAIRLLHWVLVLIVVGWTVFAAAQISAFRQWALRKVEEKSEEKMSLLITSIDYQTASKIGLYLVTLNIKIMNFVWSSVSPKIAEKENWRTDQKLKNAQVSKTFMVKCVVYYYPFFYLAFVRDWVEGCEGDECVHELKSNLAVFIITHIFTVIANVLVQIAMTWWSEYKLKQKLAEVPKDEERKLSYVEAQAMRPAYSGDTDDYMELSISLGFISMFSVVFPLCALMSLVTNLVELRVLAFRMLRVVRRPLPRGQEGIGAWRGIMQNITYLACITSVGLLVCTTPRARTMKSLDQLKWFTIFEHMMIAFVYFLESLVPEKSLANERILEAHDAAESKIFAADSTPVKATKTNVTCLKPGCDDVTPGRLPVAKS
mmetsp:Transcript_29871/g.75185  ORF Transcript_29871/g.75185 Transcript_29871/m.75185 type:complete len:872 (+) Transcript_29871:145-2760(+)